MQKHKQFFLTFAPNYLLRWKRFENLFHLSNYQSKRKYFYHIIFIMKLSQFKYNLPTNLIALHPTEERDEARLMVLHRKTQTIEHKIFKDLLDYVDDGDVFVTNNTKVFPALLYGEKEKTGAKIRVFLLRELDEESRLWDVLVDPARKIRIGNKLYFGEDDSLVAEVIDNTTSRGRTLRFLFDGTHDEFKLVLRKLGSTPIPDELQRLRDIEPDSLCQEGRRRGSSRRRFPLQSRVDQTTGTERCRVYRTHTPRRRRQFQRH